MLALGYHAISSKKHESSDDEMEYSVSQPGERRAFDMPELLHNINMLIDMTEEEIITRDRQLRSENLCDLPAVCTCTVELV